MSNSTKTVTVKLHQNDSKWPWKRPQRWSFTASSNGRVLARSSESYTNREDAESAAVLLFSDGPRVWLHSPGQDDVILREMVVE